MRAPASRRLLLDTHVFIWWRERSPRIAPDVVVEIATADAVRLRGIDTWLGGVHLRGREARWRWDAEHGSVAG